MTRRRPLSYRDALAWMIVNDDTEFLAEPEPEPAISVTGALVADIYDRSNEEVIADLRRMKAQA